MTSASGWRSPLPCRHPSGNLVNVHVRLQAPANPLIRAARPSVSALRLITPTIQFKMAWKVIH
jgi:hypothetical protein